MKVSVVTPSCLGPCELARWRSLQQAGTDLDNPFLSASFAVRVGATLPRARVAVFEDGHDIVAFFPFSQGPLRTARPLAPGVADCQGIVHVPGFEWDPKDLLRAVRLDALEFDHLLADQLPASAHHIERSDSPVVDVSQGFEPYLRQRRTVAKGVIGALERKRRKLERESECVRLEVDDRRPEVLRQLLAWKSAQYRRTGRVDRFAKGWVRPLVEALYETDELDCTGRILSLESDGRVIAALFGVGSPTVFSSWFPAYDLACGRYSPGLLLYVAAAEHAATHRGECRRTVLLGGRGRGLPTRIDLGKGDEEYKRVLANDAVVVAKASVDLGTPMALVHRLQLYPRQALVGAVVSHPLLRKGARRTLCGVGHLRQLRRAPAARRRSVPAAGPGTR